MEYLGPINTKGLLYSEVSEMKILELIHYCILSLFTFYPVIYNTYIEPNNVTTDSHFLRYDFTEKMLDALGIKDSTGVIYEMINYRFFADDVLGTWDLMIDGMINVRI